LTQWADLHDDSKVRWETIADFMFDRPMEYYLNIFFASDFILDGYTESKKNRQ